jgi:predicted TIM-barrel enzyme
LTVEPRTVDALALASELYSDVDVVPELDEDAVVVTGAGTGAATGADVVSVVSGAAATGAGVLTGGGVY